MKSTSKQYEYMGHMNFSYTKRVRLKIPFDLHGMKFRMSSFMHPHSVHASSLLHPQTA